MMIRKLFFTTIIVVLFSSCYTFRIYPKEYRDYRSLETRKLAFVENPELAKEYQILESSKIFNLTKDGLNDSAIRITLYPTQKNLRNPPGGFIWILTIGQIPMTAYDSYDYRFSETQKTRSTVMRKFELRVTTRYWFWAMFQFNKKFEEKAGQALNANYYHMRVSRAG